MQGRSWMAALTLTAATVLALGRHAGADDKPTTSTHRVRLSLRIAGLSSKGCDVEIKPAHAGCKFRPITRHISVGGVDDIDINDVETTSADRECAFAITVLEPGHAVRTVRKGLHLRTPSTSGISKLECWLSSPSKVASAKDDSSKRTR